MLEILKNFPNWLAWGPDPESGRPKCPLMIRDRTKRASTRAPKTWTDWPTAEKFLKKYGSEEGVGVGFVFTAATGLVYIDIDDALNEAGELRGWCREYVEPLAGKAYMEVSPSGRGLHIITRGALPGGVIGGKRNFPEAASGLAGPGGKPRVPEVAMFTEGKYTTITGAVWGGQDVIGDGGAAAAGVWLAAGIDASRYDAAAGPAPKEDEAVPVEASRLPASVRKELASGEKAAGEEDASVGRFRLFCDLFRAGLSPEEVFSVVTGEGAAAWWEASGAAVKGRHQVWADVLRAAAKVETAQKEFQAVKAEEKVEGAKAGASWAELGVPTVTRVRGKEVVTEAVWGVRAMVVTLHKHPEWAGRLKWNNLKERAELDGKPLEEGCLSTVAEWLRSYLRWGTEPGHPQVWVALIEAAQLSGYHPVVEWLSGLEWDGQGRLDDWLVRVGCEDSEVTRLVGRKWLISLVARAFRPGCDLQTVLVLGGEQGLKKGFFFREVAGGNREWVTKAHMGMNRDDLMSMSGHWIVELAELAAFKKADTEAVRSFVEACEDTYRAPYARKAQTKPRGFVLVGTTNDGDAEGYLTDMAGNRRYWPVKVERTLDLTAVREMREQLFAEAVVRFKAGEVWWFEEQPAALLKAQKEAQIDDPLEDKLHEALKMAGGGPVRVPTLLDALGLPSDSKALAMRVARLLKNAGWKRGEAWIDGQRSRAWRKPGEAVVANAENEEVGASH